MYFHQEDYLLHQKEDCSLLLQEVVLDLLVHHFEDILERKDYRHNLGLVLFHLEGEEVHPVDNLLLDMEEVVPHHSLHLEVG